jgi:hypothetical protein
VKDDPRSPSESTYRKLTIKSVADAQVTYTPPEKAMKA